VRILFVISQLANFIGNDKKETVKMKPMTVIGKLTNNKLTIEKMFHKTPLRYVLRRKIVLELFLHDKSPIVFNILKFWFDNYDEIDSHTSVRDIASIL